MILGLLLTRMLRFFAEIGRNCKRTCGPGCWSDRQMSTYNDKPTLNNIALTQFEMAREIPAAIDLFAKTKHLICKLNAYFKSECGNA